MDKGGAINAGNGRLQPAIRQCLQIAGCVQRPSHQRQTRSHPG